MAGRRWWVVGDLSRMVRVVGRGRRHPLCPDGGQLSSLWAVGPFWVVVGSRRSREV